MPRLPLLALPLLLATGAAAAETLLHTSALGPNPLQQQVREAIPLDGEGRVEIKGIGGSVTVTSGDAPEVRLFYRRVAASQRDLDCETLRYEPAPARLQIWVERRRGRDCDVIRANDELQLVVPRTADLSLDEVGDKVRVAGVTGMVQIAAVGDSAILEGITQLRAGSIGDTLSITLDRLAPAGIRISSVGDTVELHLPRAIGARLQIDSVGGEVRGSGIRAGGDDAAVDLELGGGGPLILISGVGDDVVIRR